MNSHFFTAPFLFLYGTPPRSIDWAAAGMTVEVSEEKTAPTRRGHPLIDLPCVEKSFSNHCSLPICY